MGGVLVGDEQYGEYSVIEEERAAYSELPAEMNELTSTVIGAAIEVHRALGPGFLEITYRRALCVELALQGIPFQCECPVPMAYKGQPVGEGRVDLIVDRRVVVELKAVTSLAPIHTAQAISYLRATGLRLGLILNFNVPVLREGIKRIVYSV